MCFKQNLRFRDAVCSICEISISDLGLCTLDSIKGHTHKAIMARSILAPILAQIILWVWPMYWATGQLIAGRSASLGDG